MASVQLDFTKEAEASGYQSKLLLDIQSLVIGELGYEGFRDFDRHGATLATGRALLLKASMNCGESTPCGRLLAAEPTPIPLVPARLNDFSEHVRRDRRRNTMDHPVAIRAEWN